MYTKNMGSVDIEEARDFWRDSEAIKDVTVYEDQNLKNRPIGFIWNHDKRIVTQWKS